MEKALGKKGLHLSLYSSRRLSEFLIFLYIMLCFLGETADRSGDSSIGGPSTLELCVKRSFEVLEEENILTLKSRAE